MSVICGNEDIRVSQILRVELHGFKAFERFTLRMRGDSFLAGPNNAGKSTLTQALRITAHTVRTAMRRGPTETFVDGPTSVLGYSFTNAQIGLSDGNLQHEFRALDARITVGFTGGATLKVLWPDGVEDEAFFYFQRGGSSVSSVREARATLPTIGVVPVLSPVDADEEVLTPKYVRDNLDGRLASRHFRNQLRLLQEATSTEDDLDAFLQFAAPWIPEMRIGDLRDHMGQRTLVLDLYYKDAGRKAEKEIAWAGDGMQIWLQLLLHVFRQQSRHVVVLDEPDVFLHPDLQRRLVRLLATLPGQTITATHSSEVLTEAAPEQIVWVDKNRKSSVSGPERSEAAGLMRALGSQFSLPLARALRAKCVLFVEGDDAKVLRELAKTAGATRVATETGIAVISLRGFDNWEHVAPFSWMAGELLDHSVKVFVLLDRDFRSDTQCRNVRKRLAEADVTCHVWKRKELECYLLEPDVIARATGADPAWVDDALREAAEEAEDDVFGQIAAETSKEFRKDQPVQAAKAAKERFEAIWSNEAARKWIAPADRVLHGLNRRLDASDFKTTSYRELARSFKRTEIPAEMLAFFDDVEDALQQAGVSGVVS